MIHLLQNLAHIGRCIILRYLLFFKSLFSLYIQNNSVELNIILIGLLHMLMENYHLGLSYNKYIFICLIKIQYVLSHLNFFRKIKFQ
jgi:hypothetical protein